MNALLNSSRLSNNQILRIRKSSYQCFFLLKSTFTNDGKDCELKITGSTLNVYTITIKDSIFRCDCPDFGFSDRNGMFCKHICFVICYIGKIKNDRIFLSRILNDEEEKQIFERLSLINTHINDDENIICRSFSEKYEAIKDETTEKNDNIPIQARNLDDDCAVCFLPLVESEHVVATTTESVTRRPRFLKIEIQNPVENQPKETAHVVPPIEICALCANAIHTNCLKTWLTYNKTCVFCRQIWKTEAKKENGYINIG